MMTRRLGLALAAMAPFAAAAEEMQPVAGPFTLVPGRTIEIVCESKSIVVATNAPQATTGSLTLSLTASEPQRGTWRIRAVDTGHTGSLGLREASACAAGCPLIATESDQIQLWSPAPKTVDHLADNETLLIAVLKTATLDLRATTFNGKQIEALEEGKCRTSP